MKKLFFTISPEQVPIKAAFQVKNGTCNLCGTSRPVVHGIYLLAPGQRLSTATVCPSHLLLMWKFELFSLSTEHVVLYTSTVRSTGVMLMGPRRT